MISIRINGEEQRNANITEQWIAEQINNRKHTGQTICVVFQIRCGDINVNLSSGECPPAGNGKPVSSFNAKTQKVIKVWEDRGLREKKVNTGRVISFWKFLKKTCS